MNIKRIVAVFVLIILFLNLILVSVQAINIPKILYSTHLRDIGWTDFVENGQTSGTTGESRRIEAINISISGLKEYKLTYQVHIKDYGWLPVMSEGQIAGTTGESRRAEAIKISLQNSDYTIKYRVHIENLDWSDWVYDGNVAGTTGRSLRIEAIQIQLVPKKAVYQEKSVLKNGIDVSKYQGDINWEKVKQAGIDFAMIRCGNRGYTNGIISEDPYFLKNVNEAYNNGIKVGLYFYSSAMNESEANQEANFVIDKIKQYGLKDKISFPIAIDIENDFPEARNYTLGVTEKNKTCKTFCNIIKNNGFCPMIYSYDYFLEYKLNLEDLKEFDIWLANYVPKTKYSGNYNIWQYTSTGVVEGIVGNVDLNYCYFNY